MSALQHIIVGLSGGVDSSVAALKLLEQGHRVEGLFMKNWGEDDDADYCAAAEDLADARAVADALGIRLHTVNFSAEYWDRVFEYFLAEYRAGRTPNPDVLCNKEIKFKAFLDHARALGADAIATGHYARKDRGPDGGIRLLKGRDPAKDQSYFLALLSQRQLAPARFPLGDLEKTDVRALAARAGLITHDKKDSTGICFIGERRFRDFLSRFLPARPGAMRDPDGNELGRHQGLMYYTPGQRRGLGIGGGHGDGNAPWFVAGKDLENNTLLVVQGHEHPLLYHPALLARSPHWIAGEAPSSPLRCAAKIRYRQTEQACEVCIQTPETLSVRFATPQWAVAPGQTVAFYQGEVCLGAAIIDQPLSETPP